jgi:hypothetical protein
MRADLLAQLHIIPSILLLRVAISHAEKVRAALAQTASKVVSWSREGDFVTILARAQSAVLPLRLPNDAKDSCASFETLPVVFFRLGTSAERLESVARRDRLLLSEIVETALGLVGLELCIVDAKKSETSDSGCTVCARLLTAQDATILKAHLPVTVHISIGESSAEGSVEAASKLTGMEVRPSSQETGTMVLRETEFIDHERKHQEPTERYPIVSRDTHQTERSTGHVPVPRDLRIEELSSQIVNPYRARLSVPNNFPSSAKSARENRYCHLHGLMRGSKQSQFCFLVILQTSGWQQLQPL